METTSPKKETALFLDSNLEFTDEEQEPEIKALTREEAQALEAKMPHLSLWSVLLIQLLAGMLVIVLSLPFGMQAGICAAAGVFAAWLPALLFVWRTGAHSRKGQNFSLIGFYFWEGIKILTTIALLAWAMFELEPLVWQALLAGFVVTVKAYSLGCWILLNKKVKRSNGY